MSVEIEPANNVIEETAVEVLKTEGESVKRLAQPVDDSPQQNKKTKLDENANAVTQEEILTPTPKRGRGRPPKGSRSNTPKSTDAKSTPNKRGGRKAKASQGDTVSLDSSVLSFQEENASEANLETADDVSLVTAIDGNNDADNLNVTD